MYTWGYIKDASLAKLDLDEQEASEQHLLSRFPFFANEAMTQICSAIKPKRTFVTFKVADKQKLWNDLKRKYKVYSNEQEPIVKPDTLTNEETSFWKDFESYIFTGDDVKMPDDFVSFGSDVCTRTWQDFMYNTILSECRDTEMRYKGYNQIVFFEEGTYSISYNARWIVFYKEMDNNIVLDAPNDVLDCIPSYIASQGYKIDDEAKSSIYRNEYEMFLARIDDTNYKQTKTFEIGGDW